MTQRVTVQHLVITNFLLLLATGLVSVLGFHRIGNDMAERHLRSEEAERGTPTVQRLLAQQQALLARGIRDTATPAAVLAELAPGIEQLESLMTHADLNRPADTTVVPRSLWQNYRTAIAALAEARGANEASFNAACAAALAAAVLLDDDLTGPAAATTDTHRAGLAITRTAGRFSMLVVALTTTGMLAALSLNHRISEHTIRPLRRIAEFLDRSAAHLPHERLLTHDDQAVNAVAEAANRLVDSIRRAAETSRRETRDLRQLADALTECLPAAVVAVTPAGDVVAANTKAQAMLEAASDDARQVLAAIHAAVQHSEESFHLDNRRFVAASLLDTGSTRWPGAIIQVRDAGNSTS